MITSNTENSDITIADIYDGITIKKVIDRAKRALRKAQNEVKKGAWSEGEARGYALGRLDNITRYMRDNNIKPGEGYRKLPDTLGYTERNFMDQLAKYVGIDWRAAITKSFEDLRKEANLTITEAQYGTCMRCGRTLTVPESVARGIGPICIKKIGSAAADRIMEEAKEKLAQEKLAKKQEYDDPADLKKEIEMEKFTQEAETFIKDTNQSEQCAYLCGTFCNFHHYELDPDTCLPSFDICTGKIPDPGTCYTTEAKDRKRQHPVYHDGHKNQSKCAGCSMPIGTVPRHDGLYCNEYCCRCCPDTNADVCAKEKVFGTASENLARLQAEKETELMEINTAEGHFSELPSITSLFNVDQAIIENNDSIGVIRFPDDLVPTREHEDMVFMKYQHYRLGYPDIEAWGKAVLSVYRIFAPKSPVVESIPKRVQKPAKVDHKQMSLEAFF